MSTDSSTVNLRLAAVGPYAPSGGIKTHMRYLIAISSTAPLTEPLTFFIAHGASVDLGECSENVGEAELRSKPPDTLAIPLQPQAGPLGWVWTIQFGFAFQKAIQPTLSVSAGGKELAKLTKIPFIEEVKMHRARAEVEAEEFKDPDKRTLRLQRNCNFPRLSLAISEISPLSLRDPTQSVPEPRSAEEFVRAASLELMTRLNEGFQALWARWESDNGSVLPLDVLGRALKEGAEKLPGNFSTREEAKIHYANERWARAITEQLLLVSYGGSGDCYFGRASALEKTGAENYEDLLRELGEELAEGESVSFRHSLDYVLCKGLNGESQGDSYYPLVAACQHLASLGVFSRDVRILPNIARGAQSTSLASATLNAGSYSAVTLTQNCIPKGAWMVQAGEAAKPVSAPGGENYELTTAKLAESLGDKVPPALSRYESPKTEIWVAAAGKNADGQVCELGPGSVAVFANYPTQGLVRDPEIIEDYYLKGYYVGEQVHRYRDGWKRYVANQLEFDAKKRATAPLKPMPPTPVAFSPGQQKLLADNTIGAHVGFVLRVGRGPNPEVQTFDTGGLGTGEAEGALLLAGQTGTNAGGLSHFGSMDYGPQRSLSGGAPFRGVGFLPRQSESDADALLRHVETVLEKARPLGFVRFLFVKGHEPGAALQSQRYFKLQDWLVCATPLLRMHTHSRAFSLARFIWALKELPWTQEYSILTSFHFPRKQLAEAVLQSGRSSSLAELADAALRITSQGGTPYHSQAVKRQVEFWSRPDEKLKSSNLSPGGTKLRFARESFLASSQFDDYKRQRLLFSLTRPLLELTTVPGGKARELYRYRTPLPIGTYPHYHWLERDQLPLDRAVQPLISGSTDEQGSWNGTSEGKLAFDVASQAAESLLGDFYDLFAR